MPLWAAVAAILLTATIAVFGNMIAAKVTLAESLPGMALLVGCIFAGMAIAKLLGALKIPALIWVSIVGVLISMPYSPIAATVNPLVAKIGLLPVVTPVLAYAGLSLAKDLPILKALGWRIVVVSLLANAGAFVAGAAIAQAFGG